MKREQKFMSQMNILHKAFFTHWCELMLSSNAVVNRVRNQCEWVLASDLRYRELATQIRTPFTEKESCDLVCKPRIRNTKKLKLSVEWNDMNHLKFQDETSSRDSLY